MWIMKKQILFLHGFLASGNGNKSQYLKNYVKNNFDNYEVLSPDIADELDLSFSSIESFIKNNTENLVAVVGSSLGGYWSYRVFRKYHLPAVLINPVVEIQSLVHHFAGKHVNFCTKHEFIIDPNNPDNDVEQVTPLNAEEKKLFMVLLGTKDEVLDYHIAERFYAGANIHILEGEDHRIQNFDKCCPLIMDFIVNNSK